MPLRSVPGRVGEPQAVLGALAVDGVDAGGGFIAPDMLALHHVGDARLKRRMHEHGKHVLAAAQDGPGATAHDNAGAVVGQLGDGARLGQPNPVHLLGLGAHMLVVLHV